MSLIDKDTDNIFGERLKNLRKHTLHKTQKEFAEMLDIPQPTLSAYESGRNKPTIDVVINIAEKCNISIDWLCGRSKTPKLNSLGDIFEAIFEIYETKEITPKTVIHDRVDLEDVHDEDDEKRNWTQMRFYHNEDKLNPEDKYSYYICDMITRASEMHRRHASYDYPQDYYEAQKQKLIARYEGFPITKLDHSSLSEDERLRLHDEIMMKRIEARKKALSQKQE